MSTNFDHRDDDDVSGDLSGQFLRQADFETMPEFLGTITTVEKIEFEARNGRPAEAKWVVSFVGDRKLSLNKTNLALLAKWFGNKSSAWRGQRVAVYRDESVSFGGRLVGGLRVRRPAVPTTSTLPPGGEAVTEDETPF